MNRNSAKLLTFAGFVLCSISIIFTIYKFIVEADFSFFISLFLFVGGIVLVVFSLAYYTER